MNGSRSSIAGLALSIALSAAGPAAAENVLRFTGMDSGTAVMDPHSTAWPERRVATKQVYEALLEIDSNLALVPQLAVAWNVAGLTHWDFELRRDVVFHDGSPFSARDVVFSIERARAKTSDFRGYVGSAMAEPEADTPLVGGGTAAGTTLSMSLISRVLDRPPP